MRKPSKAVYVPSKRATTRAERKGVFVRERTLVCGYCKGAGTVVGREYKREPK